MQKDKAHKYSLENKNALIFVGRMGHGKTSACKENVNDSERHRIKPYEGIGTGTLKCETYMSNRFNDIFGEDIVVVDTPGLESKATVSLLAEDIDELILEYKLNIVGIAYVLDIKQRDKNQQGQSYIFTFLDLLRVKYCYKINLIFFLLSKYDKHYGDVQSNEKLMKGFQDQFIKRDSVQMWNRRIQWMSQPVLDKISFLKKKDLQLKKEYEDQFETLKNFLKKIKEQGHILIYKTYESDRNQFEVFFKDSFVKSYDKFQYQKDFQNLELNIEVQQVQKGYFRIIKQHLSIVFGSLGTFFSLQSGQQFITQSIKEKKIGSLSEIALTLAFGWGSYRLARKGIQDFLQEQYSENLQLAKNQQIAKYRYIRRIGQKLKFFLTNAVMDQCKIKGNILTIKRLPYVAKIQSLDMYDQKNQIQSSGQLIAKTKLSVGRNRIIIFYKTPSRQCFEGFLKEYSSIFYNGRK